MLSQSSVRPPHATRGRVVMSRPTGPLVSPSQFSATSLTISATASVESEK